MVSADSIARGDALSCLECSSISRGLVALDAMIKRAPSRLLYQGRYSGGNYLILMHGDVASVEESHQAGLEAAKERVIAASFLPVMHPNLWRALLGDGELPSGESLLLVEMTSVAESIDSLDRVLKLIEGSVVDFQLGTGIGGKGYFALEAPLYDLETAVNELECTVSPDTLVCVDVIPRPHEELLGSFQMKHPFSHPWCRDIGR